MDVSFSEVIRGAIARLAQQTFWEENTEDVKEAVSYCKDERKLCDKILRDFRFGYYPTRLFREGHTWAGRLIMPLHDQHDDLIALTSRDFRCKPKEGMPHLHEEFDKKYFLFGANIAKDSIIQKQEVILVEGQFDTAISHSEGFSNTVGILGSALTMLHICVLTRYCGTFYLVFDRDEAGYKNLSRSIKLYKNNNFEAFGITFVPVLLPKHKDPDEFLRKENKNAYREVLKKAMEGVRVNGSVGYYDELVIENPEIRIEKT